MGKFHSLITLPYFLSCSLSFFCLFLRNTVFHNLPDCQRATVAFSPSPPSLTLNISLTSLPRHFPFFLPLLNSSFPRRLVCTRASSCSPPPAQADEPRQGHTREGASAHGKEATLHSRGKRQGGFLLIGADSLQPPLSRGGFFP